MPRIRTIKPSFWSDEKVVELSPLARLYFIGLWNFSDDYGNLEYSPKQLKMRIYPGDSVNIEALTEELLTHEIVLQYEVENKKYLHIRNFTKHQKINRISTEKCPPPPKTKPLTAQADNYPQEGKGSGRDIDLERKGKEVEGKGVEREGKLNSTAAVDNSKAGAKDDGANGTGNALSGIPVPAPCLMVGNMTPEQLKESLTNVRAKETADVKWTKGRAP